MRATTNAGSVSLEQRQRDFLEEMVKQMQQDVKKIKRLEDSVREFSMEAATLTKEQALDALESEAALCESEGWDALIERELATKIANSFGFGVDAHFLHSRKPLLLVDLTDFVKEIIRSVGEEKVHRILDDQMESFTETKFDRLYKDIEAVRKVVDKAS